ncbi:unnamed protein product [Porites lobata]|uniref:Myb/SANT-like domain-containing protein n=1 Tax=Porites lobata TaxID=104759 RepID=A0ABN8N2E4_9CNID|nr:unnamed protein product [Porites lobata]
MATKKQPVMEWTDDHDILLLREMIATEFFQCKKGSPDRGKIWESIQERLNKLDNPKFMIKEKKSERRWNLLQAKFKRDITRRATSHFSAKDKKKSDDKEAAEEIRKKAMERMKRKSTESAGGSAKKSQEAGVMRLNS